MKILLTGVEAPVPQIAERLCGAHALSRVEQLPRAAAELPGLLAGCEAIIHGGAFLPGLGEQDALDIASRRTHDLFQAAAQAEVERVIYLGTLDLFRHYPAHYRIDENWQPLAPADLRPLCLYLGELVCREFARAHAFPAVCLRLGRVVGADDVADREPEPDWIDARDAARAVEAALAAPPDPRFGGWRLFHIAGRFPNPRFPTGLASRALGFAPEYAFGAFGEGEA